MKKEEAAKLIEAVAVETKVNKDMIDYLIEDAKNFQYCMVVAPLCCVAEVTGKLAGTGIGYAAPISSPTGLNETTAVKIQMARECIADSKVMVDIDMVMNLYYLYSGMYDLAIKDIKDMRDEFPDNIIKVIIEAPSLNDELLKKACEIVLEGGADYIKTSTGAFGPTSVELVKKIRSIAGYEIGIKAAGGIRTLDTIERLVDLGVDRIGMNYRAAHDFFLSE